MQYRLLIFFLLILSSFSGATVVFCQPTWMGDNAPLLAAKRLNEIALPGAHDAGTFAIPPAKKTDVIFGANDGISSPDNKTAKRLLSIGGVFSRWAKTQERTTAEMLADGIRYFDIRVCVDEKGVLMTCHGIYGASVAAILEDIRVFTSKNPKEIVLIGFNHFWDRKYQVEKNKGQGEIEGLTTANWQELLKLIGTKLDGKLLSNSKFDPASKLADVWKSKKQVIALFDTDDVPDADFVWKRKEENTWVAGWEIDSFKEGTLKVLDNAKRNVYSSKFYAIRSSVTPDDNGKLAGLGLISKDYPSSASDLANTTNPIVFDWIRNDWRAKYPINLIWADYYNRHGLVNLAKSLNGIKVPPSKLKPRDETKWRRWKNSDGSIRPFKNY